MIAEEKIRVHLFISGRVQGVFFRDFSQRKAQQLGLKGWVKNLPDGRVEAVLEGEKERVEKMLLDLQEGPPGAKVENIETQTEEYRGEFENFSIIY